MTQYSCNSNIFLNTRLLTRRQEVPDLVISLRERVENPPASGEVPLVGVVVVVGQGPEAVDPKTYALNLGPVEPKKIRWQN